MTDHVTLAEPPPVRQATSHAHMITSDPVTGDILVADLGSDTILVYSLGDEGRLTPKTASNVNAVPGAGPRHLAFHPGRAPPVRRQRARQHRERAASRG